MSEIKARKTIEDFFKAFNNHDSEAHLQTIHFPHIRINGQGQVRINQTASDFPPLSTTLPYLSQKEGWHHSTLDSVEAIHVSEEKVHFNIQFSRYKADGSRYAVHKSLWIITQKGGKWGVQARSSYAL